MSLSNEQWVLAFDASCDRCRAISAAVATASGGKLEVLSLLHPDVVRWRQQSLGSDAPWAPTFIRVRSGGRGVRAWTGSAMALPLVRHLGPRATFAVLAELGHLKRQSGKNSSHETAAGIGRKQFLRLGAGAVVAAGLIVAGRTPAFAEGEQVAARKWVEANMDRLPRKYEEVVAHPMAYRRAIYAQLPQNDRQSLWLEQLQRYRSAHPGLSAEQRDVLDVASAFVERGFVAAEGEFGANERMRESMIAAFGEDGARALFTRLGPEPDPTGSVGTAGAVCTCSTWDDWCSGTTCMNFGECDRTSSGCGTFWSTHCDGICYN